MDLHQWEYEFDILYDNIDSNQAPELNPLEKSIILTEAQEDVFLSLYSGSTSTTGFEGSEEITEYLRTHVKTEEFEDADFEETTIESWKVTVPDDCWFPVYEEWKTYKEGLCVNGTIAVTPTTHDELTKVLRNPFKRPSKRTVLRVTSSEGYELFLSSDFNLSHMGQDKLAEGYEHINTYVLRYLAKLNPIILPGCNNYINGTSAQDCDYPAFWTSDNKGKNCELPEQIHRKILLRAIQIAKAAWA